MQNNELSNNMVKLKSFLEQVGAKNIRVTSRRAIINGQDELTDFSPGTRRLLIKSMNRR